MLDVLFEFYLFSLIATALVKFTKIPNAAHRLAGRTRCSSCVLLCCGSTSSSPRCSVTTCFATSAPSWRRRRQLSSLWQSALLMSCASRQMVATETTAPCQPGAAWRRRTAARCTASASKEPSIAWATAAVTGRTVTPARASQPGPSTSP